MGLAFEALARGGVEVKRTGPGRSSLSLGRGGGNTVRVITRGPMKAPFPLFLLASLFAPLPDLVLTGTSLGSVTSV